MIKGLLVGAGLALASCLNASAATFSYDAKANIVTMHGDIVDGDTKRFYDLLARVPARSRFLNLRLDSHGGNLIESASLGAMVSAINSSGIEVRTVVAFGETCASACISVFAAGARRFVEGHSPGLVNGTLAVHTATINDQETPEAMADNVAWIRDLKALGVPDRVLVKLLDTSSRQAQQLTEGDLAAWGVRWIVVDGTQIYNTQARSDDQD